MSHVFHRFVNTLSVLLSIVALTLLTVKTGHANPIYSADVLATPGLVSYWRLGETTGATTAVDQTGANPGTYVSPGSTLYGQSGAIVQDPNTAVHFNGSTSYVNAGNSASLNAITGGETLMAWINPDNTTGPQNEIIGTWAQTLAGDRFGIFQIGADLFLTANNGTTEAVMQIVNPGLQAGHYSFVVGTWDSTGAMNFYFNGQNVMSLASGLTSLKTSTAQFHIGAEDVTLPSDPQARFFPGKIDEAAVFNQALTGAQIQALYQAGIAAPEPGSILLMGLGGAALVWSAVRRGRSTRQSVAKQDIGEQG